MRSASRIGTVAAGVLLAATSLAPAAVISWQTGPTYGGPGGEQAISTVGNHVQAVNLGAFVPMLVDPQGLNMNFTPGNQLNAGPFDSGSPETGDVGFDTVIRQTRFNGTNATLGNFFTGLMPGIDYQVQLFASDSRPCCATRTQSFSDGLGNDSPTIVQGDFTSIVGSFTADGTGQTLGLNASSNNPVLSAYVIREISAAGTKVTFIDENIEGNGNGWGGWGGALAPPYLNLLPLANDIDDPTLTNATASPDALNILDGNVPFANDAQVASKTYAVGIHEGTYEFFVQAVNWNNAAFGTPQFGFNGLMPDSVLAPAPGSGDDEIWRFLFTVDAESPLLGQAIQLSFGGSTPGGGANFGIDHILATFTTPVAAVPEPATALLGVLGLGAMALRRRRMA